MMIWSEPYGDIGRLAETSGPPGTYFVQVLGLSNRVKRNSLSGKKLPLSGVIPTEKYPLITVKPYPTASSKVEAMVGG